MACSLLSQRSAWSQIARNLTLFWFYICGFNIAIIIVILVGIADPFVSRKTAVIIAMVGIVLYTILVGAEASVIRAAVMGSIFLITSRWLGRPNFAYASLFFTGFFMTLLNPYTLWDVGFQLSFTATLGLMLYADSFSQWTRKRLSRIMDRKLTNQTMSIVSEAVLLTVAAQILTLPLMIGYFGQLSLVSLLSNAFILPIQSGVMLWGGLATIFGMIWQPLGQLFGWIAWLFLTATIGLVRAFASVPWASVPVDVPPIGIVFMFSIILGITWYAKQTKERRGEVMSLLRKNLGQKKGRYHQYHRPPSRIQLEPEPTRRLTPCCLFKRRSRGRHLHPNANRTADIDRWWLLPQRSQRPTRAPDALLGSPP